MHQIVFGLDQDRDSKTDFMTDFVINYPYKDNLEIYEILKEHFGAATASECLEKFKAMMLSP
jgi:hypothetical protein